MSKKRTSSEQQTNGDSELLAHDGDVKRARLGSWSDKTMEDLPSELIESILIKAIVMEVKGLKVENSVWKEKADLVISRLCTVCSHWSDILTTNFFRKELHRALESAQETIRLEILHQSQIQGSVGSMAAIRDEIFLLKKSYYQQPQIDVYDRNNMAVVKDVIPLPRVNPEQMSACSVSNCLYMLNRKIRNNYFSVLRISRDNQNRFAVEPFIKFNIYLPEAGMCVSPNGNLSLVRKQTKRIDAITVCDPNGYVQHTVRLPMDVNKYDQMTVKSNGNHVLVQAGDQRKAKLIEISMNGDIIREYQSSASMLASFAFADQNERMLIFDYTNRPTMELLDSEFNLVYFSTVQPIGSQFNFPCHLCCNIDRNEMIAHTCNQYTWNSPLTIFKIRRERF